jgi:hypothetical protein
MAHLLRKRKNPPAGAAGGGRDSDELWRSPYVRRRRPRNIIDRYVTSPPSPQSTPISVSTSNPGQICPDLLVEIGEG